MWSIANTADNLSDLKRLFGERLEEVTATRAPALPKVALNTQDQEELDRNHQKMVLKGFSASTIRNYQQALQRFFQYFSNADLPTLTKAQIEGFVYQMVTKYRIGDQAQNTLINAIKCYYGHTLEKPREYYEITRPRKSHDLPNVRSAREVMAIINQPPKTQSHAALLVWRGFASGRTPAAAGGLPLAVQLTTVGIEPPNELFVRMGTLACGAAYDNNVALHYFFIQFSPIAFGVSTFGHIWLYAVGNFMVNKENVFYNQSFTAHHICRDIRGAFGMAFLRIRL